MRSERSPPERRPRPPSARISVRAADRLAPTASACRRRIRPASVSVTSRARVARAAARRRSSRAQRSAPRRLTASTRGHAPPRETSPARATHSSATRCRTSSLRQSRSRFPITERSIACLTGHLSPTKLVECVSGTHAWSTPAQERCSSGRRSGSRATGSPTSQARQATHPSAPSTWRAARSCPRFIDAHTHLASDTSRALVWATARAARRGAAAARARLPSARTVLPRAPRGWCHDGARRSSFDDEAIVMRRGVELGLHLGPRILSCGRIISATSHERSPVRPMYAEADGQWEMRRAVREQLRRGADFVKLMATEAQSVERETPSRRSSRARRSGLSWTRRTGSGCGLRHMPRGSRAPGWPFRRASTRSSTAAPSTATRGSYTRWQHEGRCSYRR